MERVWVSCRDGAQQGGRVSNAASRDVHGTAMSHAGEQRVRADAQRTRGVGGQQLDRDVALVVEHRDVEIVAALREHHVGALRAFDVEPRGPQGLRGRHGDALVLQTEQRAFGRVRVDAEEADARAVHAERLAGAHARVHRVQHQRRRHARQRGRHALVQRGVQDAQATAHEEHEHLVFRHPADTRHQRGVATEGDAGLVDRGLVVRAGDDGVERAGAAGLQCGGGAGHGGDAGGGVDAAGHGMRGVHRARLDMAQP